MNVSLTKSQKNTFSEIVNTRFPLVLTDRGSGSTFLLCYYAIHRAVTRKSRIIILCHAERLRRNILKQLSEILESDIVGDTIHINGSKIVCMTVGYPDKCRGFRATDILISDYESIDKEALRDIISSFSSRAVTFQGVVDNDNQCVIFGSSGFDSVLELSANYNALSQYEQDTMFKNKYSTIELKA